MLPTTTAESGSRPVAGIAARPVDALAAAFKPDGRMRVLAAASRL